MNSGTNTRVFSGPGTDDRCHPVSVVRLRLDLDYVLERSTTLPAIEAGWTPVQRMPGTGGVLEFSTKPPEGAEALFYRLRPVPLW